ncbi:MAG: hypothetical protein E7084_08195 [Bacteroidales bacterium]|nr:hypothetical protein [Bacteroidales bacterium]
MRKNLLFTALAATTLLLATSCQQDEVFVDGNEATVTFEVGTPEIATRAFSKGEKATKLQYAVYDAEFNYVDREGLHGTIDFNKQANVPLQLAAGKTYKVLFWADAYGNAQDAPYTVDFAALKMNVNYTGAVCNDESRDAFYNFVEVTVGQANETKEVTLTRPFAQLNIGTDDLNKLDGVSADQTQVKVNVYDQLDLKTGFVTTGATATTQTFTLADRPAETEEFPVSGYDYLAMNYLLVGKDKTVVDVEFSYGADAATAKTRTYTGIPVQPNYRTNIYGSLLTQGIDFDVEIEPGYNDDNKHGMVDGKTYMRVDNIEEFNAAFADGDIDMIILNSDIVLNSTLTRAGGDPVLTVSAGKDLIIDLNEKTLSSTSSATGKNYNMFDVRGTLTVKNGTIEYEHTGDNMAWNNFAEIFYVGFNGTLNLDGVTAKNLGGSDMAYVIDMVNATNITVNVNNSTLQSTYIPIRVFNNSKTGVNNVTIKNTTLDGKYCFWVQYWLADGRDQATLDNTLKLDIFNSENGESNSNTFTYNNAKNAPVLYGFNEAVYFDEYGEEISFYTPIEGAEGVALDTEGNYVITADEGLASLSALITAENADGFAGKTIKLDTDVDLATVKTNGNSFAPIGSTGERDASNRLICEPFKGTFDGNGHAIKNLYQSGWDMGYDWDNYGSLGLFAQLESATVKNVVIEGLEAQVEGGDISFIAGSATGNCVFENITINNSSIGTYNNGCGGIIGWSGAGTYTFKNITLGSDVVLGGLWGSFDSSIGGIVGQAEPGATYNFENVEINCRIDAYNDCTASYDYYNYRMCGMIIGRCEATTTIDGVNYPDLSQYNLTFNNVTVNYGKWMNYHYCEPTPGHNGGRGMRVEPGYAYGGLPEDFDHTQCTTNHYACIPFDQLIGGDQLGVKGLKAVDGVTVNYPAEYTCPLCGQQHNVK